MDDDDKYLSDKIKSLLLRIREGEDEDFYMDDDDELEDDVEKKGITYWHIIISSLAFLASVIILYFLKRIDLSAGIIIVIQWGIMWYLIYTTSNVNIKRSIDKNTYRDYLIEKLSGKQDKKDDFLFSFERRYDDKDIIALMLKNNDEITEYFKISKSQAKTSYLFSIVACCIGISLLIISIIGIFVVKNVEIAIISLIIGAITEVIAGTVLWVHNKSALQLNHYYSALHENEKFLSAVKLVEKISISNRDDVYKDIIKRQIKK